jgi:glutamine synthetase
MDHYRALSSGSFDFVARHGLWDEEATAAAEALAATLESLSFVRVVYGDPHGLVRSKTVSAEVFRTVLRNGMDASPGPFVFDTAHAVAVDFFAPEGGIGVPELTGAGDFLLVPDPGTFRVLPHTGSRIGWVIADEYLRDGRPHPLSSRRVLRELVTGLAARDLVPVIGLELEWYLTRVVDDRVAGRVGGFGVQGRPPRVEPVDAGYQFNLDQLCDALMPVLEPITDALVAVGLPVRTVEHESGPGQLEFTFSPMDALAAADAVLLFRGITKQVCARHGHHASFMALPGLAGFDPSGWHLHQSVFERTAGRNAFVGADDAGPLSEFGMAYVAGLLEHAAAAMPLCVPTVNGYRRMAADFSLSPDRVVWSLENRGALVRVLGGPGDPTSHVENRVGDPAANPYLYIAAQVAAGMDGVDRGLAPGAAASDPHAVTATAVPTTLGQALVGFRGSDLYRTLLGEPLVRCLCALKQSEWDRYEKWCAANGREDGSAVSEWEHREYFAIY